MFSTNAINEKMFREQTIAKLIVEIAIKKNILVSKAIGIYFDHYPDYKNKVMESPIDDLFEKDFIANMIKDI